MPAFTRVEHLICATPTTFGLWVKFLLLQIAGIKFLTVTGKNVLLFLIKETNMGVFLAIFKSVEEEITSLSTVFGKHAICRDFTYSFFFLFF